MYLIILISTKIISAICISVIVYVAAGSGESDFPDNNWL